MTGFPLPPGWSSAALPSLISEGGIFIDGDWVESKDQDPNGEIRLTQLADVGDGSWRNRSHRFLTQERARKLGCTYLERGDVLVARMPDPLGRACIFPGDERPCVTAVDICIVRPGGEQIVNRWLVHFINAPAFREAIHSLQSGSTRKRISRSNLATLDLPVPPTAEQHRLVEAVEAYLTRLDNSVETLERVQRNLQRYRASILKAAVEGRLVATEAELARAAGREYEPASVLLERILTERRRCWEEAELARMKASGKAPTDDRWKGSYHDPRPPETSRLRDLPQGWCWSSVAQLGDVTGGITKNARRDNLPLELPYLRVANVYADKLKLNDISRIRVTQAEARRALLEPGDLLVVEGNGSVDQIGRVAIWDGEIAPCLHQNHLIKARFHLPALAEWSLAWLLSPAGRSAIEGVASSTSGLHTLSLSKVERLPVPLPPLAEQVRIKQEIDRLSTVQRATLREVYGQALRCRRLRQSVLKWAFEGKLVEQDSNDEPASVLLARIKAEREAADNGGAADGRRRGGVKRARR